MCHLLDGGPGAGQEFSPGGFTVTLPDLATATGAGLPSSGPVYLGLRIDPAGAVPELNPHDQSGVHRGEDWEALTILTPVPTGVTDLSKADPSLDTQAEGTLLTPGQADTYTFTVTQTQGSGRLTAVVTPTAGTLTPLLTLAGPDGTVLVQSGSQIVQHLQPGSYRLTVSARSGAGAYRLTTQSVQASPPGDPLAVGFQPDAVAVADLNGDGIPDMLVADQGSNDIAELFGSYGANGAWVATPGPRLKSGGSGPVAVSVRDVTGNGIPDLVVTNGQSGTFTVLPGVGQGFFNDQNPRVLNVPGNPVLEAPSFFGTSNQGVMATADGRLIGFDLADFAASVGTVFAPPDGEGVAAVEALADGHVVAALEGGTVVDLAPSNGGLVVERTFLSLSGISSDPSALEVLEGASGLQVLVTNAGGDRVFVFGIPSLPESPALPPAEVAAGPTVEVTPPVEGSLTLVVTLIAGPVPAGGAAVAEAPQDAGPAPAPPAEAAEAALPWNAGGAEDVAAGPGDDGPRPGEGGIDVPGQLRGIDLYQPPPDPDRPGLISQRPGEAGRGDRAVIALTLNGSPPPAARALTAQPPTDPEPADAWAPPVEVVRAAGDTPGRATASPGEATDAVFALSPARWHPEHARLMALAAFVGWAWSDHLLYAQSQGAEVTAGRRSRRVPQIRARD